jgi:transcription initiation factor TFIIIB Brf1 subunit/transcription initiation factor TFIIB
VITEQLHEAITLLQRAEQLVRTAASTAGRGPTGLALNATATEVWKVRALVASVTETGSRELPVGVG